MLREPANVQWLKSEPKRTPTSFFLFLQEHGANYGDPGDKKTSNEWCQTWQAMGAHDRLEYVQLAETLERGYQEQKDEFSRMWQYKVRACVVMI